MLVNYVRARNTTNKSNASRYTSYRVSVCAQIQIEVFLDLEAGDVDPDDVKSESESMIDLLDDSE